jgi:hypothetical protein
MAEAAQLFLNETKNHPKIQLLHKIEGQGAVDAYICAELTRGLLTADEMKEWENRFTKKEKEGSVLIIYSRLKIKNKDIHFRLFIRSGEEEFTIVDMRIAGNKKAIEIINACLP